MQNGGVNAKRCIKALKLRYFEFSEPFPFSNEHKYSLLLDM